MRRVVGAMTLLVLLVPAGAQEKDTKSPPSEEKTAPDKPPADHYVSVGVVAGVVQDTGGTSGNLTLKVTLRYLEPNPQAEAAYVRRYQQLFARQQAILTNRNFVQRQQQLAQLLRDAEGLLASQKDLVRVKEVQENVELPLAEQVKVRALVPPQAFDDKGNIKHYTAKELKELRGPENLPGFPAETSDLQVGQTVLVKLMVRKKAPARKPDPKEPSAESQKETAPPDDGKPHVHLIVIAEQQR
jgi:hypothetical protein